MGKKRPELKIPPEVTAPVDPRLDQHGAMIATLAGITAAYHERISPRVPDEVAAVLTQQLGERLLAMFIPVPPEPVQLMGYGPEEP